jgi:hypothetical protein
VAGQGASADVIAPRLNCDANRFKTLRQDGIFACLAPQLDALSCVLGCGNSVLKIHEAREWLKI